MVAWVALQAAGEIGGLTKLFGLLGKLQRGAGAGDRRILLLRRRQAGQQPARLRELAEPDEAAHQAAERGKIVRLGLQDGAVETGRAGIILRLQRLVGGFQARSASLGPAGPARRSMKAMTWLSGSAPIKPSSGWPFLKAMTAGIDWMPSCPAICG